MHINNLKQLRPRESKVFRVIVAEESAGEREVCEKKRMLGEEKCAGFKEEELAGVLEEFQELFSERPGLCTLRECAIEVAVNLPVRRVPFKLREGVETAITKMLRDRVIEESTSVWSSPIVPVVKPDGSVRVCVDYRGLNEVTPLQRHYMPTLEEVLDRAGNSSVLSTLDLTAGFHQIRVSEECRDLTTFSCPQGKFRFRRMMFGLKNAPAIF